LHWRVSSMVGTAPHELTWPLLFGLDLRGKLSPGTVHKNLQHRSQEEQAQVQQCGP
jgi:hypothetical protein